MSFRQACDLGSCNIYIFACNTKKLIKRWLRNFVLRGKFISVLSLIVLP